MTNIADCLQRGIDFGELDRQRGIEMLREFDQLVARYATIMPEAQARARAAADLKEANKAKTARRRHVVMNQMQAMARIRNLILTSKDPAEAIKSLIEYNPAAGMRGESVRSLAEAFINEINANLYDVLKEVGQDVFSRSRNVKLLESIIRELHNEASGNPLAKAYAAKIREQQQWMRRTFNAHGGDIGDLADFGVSHAHDAGQLRLKGFDAWSQKIYQLLAWDRILNLSTGKPFASAGQIPPLADVQAFLKDIYDGIVTRGWDDRDPSLSLGGRALANQRADHRVLHFKNGSAWLEYNREFGTSDPFSAMMGGLHGLANDVAMLRVLGPNPRAGLNFAIQVAKVRAADMGEAGLDRRVAKAGKRALVMLAHHDGSANIPEDVIFARFMSGTRSVLTGIQLGSAVLSSLTDAATIAAAARTLGLSRTAFFSRWASTMFSQATRETAAQAGYIAETLADSGSTMARYMGKNFGTGLPERISSFTLRATGLSYLTDVNRISFQMETSAHLARMASKPFDQIDAPIRMMLERRGITAADWDMLRDPSTLFRPKGEDGPAYLTPHFWLETQTRLPRAEAQGLAMRLQMAVREQLEIAVPTASLEMKAFTRGALPPGTIAGEFMASVTAYKNYPLSLMLNQYRRFAEAESWGMSRAGYAVMVFSVPLILTGAMVVQTKELSKGNDPRPMDTLEFWLQALMQGGGLGIFGDFFGAAQSRTGGGFAETAAGPVFGLADDIFKPVIANSLSALKGERTYFGRDAANFVRRNTPFLSSAWYLRTAYSRLVADEMQAFLDPEAELLARRRLKKMARDYGTQPYIPVKGTGTSFRMPDFSNALGGN